MYHPARHGGCAAQSASHLIETHESHGHVDHTVCSYTISVYTCLPGRNDVLRAPLLVIIIIIINPRQAQFNLCVMLYYQAYRLALVCKTP